MTPASPLTQQGNSDSSQRRTPPMTRRTNTPFHPEGQRLCIPREQGIECTVARVVPGRSSRQITVTFI
eukprot:2758103-Amphidinium_carterae.2